MLYYGRRIKEDIKMTFTAYVERQKKLIRSRHEGEVYLIEKGETVPLTDSSKLLADLSSFKGLNTNERIIYGRRV
jgi:hypothetical protein